MLLWVLYIYVAMGTVDICEEPELKQRILEMRDEMESNRATKSSELKHRRSQNTRRYVTSQFSVIFPGHVLVDSPFYSSQSVLSS